MIIKCPECGGELRLATIADWPDGELKHKLYDDSERISTVCMACGKKWSTRSDLVTA